MVQTVRHELSSTDFVLKAFATSAAFKAEAALYNDGDKPLGAFLPNMREILDTGSRNFRDPHGHIMPPCIIMEKGESLDFWRERAAPDQPLVYAVRATRSELHCAPLNGGPPVLKICPGKADICGIHESGPTRWHYVFSVLCERAGSHQPGASLAATVGLSGPACESSRFGQGWPCSLEGR